MVAFATHLIKVRGEFDEKWSEQKLREYVDEKIRKIDPIYHPDLELLKIEQNTIEVWVFIQAFPSEATSKIISDWLDHYITEEGIRVRDFEIKEIMSIHNFFDETKPKFFIQLP